MYINKKLFRSAILIFLFSLWGFYLLTGNYSKVIVGDLSKSVIRFHVLANSDSLADQALKMKVKERVINYIEENTKNVSDVDAAACFLKENTGDILNVAKSVILENGYSYNVNAYLGTSDFPDKSYGDVTLPAGNYNAFIIKIGRAQGHNWWCVLYPPLCFIDATTGVLPDSSKDSLKEFLSSSEYNYVTSDNKNDGKIHFSFKFLDFFN